MKRMIRPRMLSLCSDPSMVFLAYNEEARLRGKGLTHQPGLRCDQAASAAKWSDVVNVDVVEVVVPGLLL